MPLTSVWLTWALLTVQLTVEWQLPQLVDVLKCEDPSPCTNIPSCVVLLWHDAQVPLTSVWLTWALLTVQLTVEWQLPQLVDVLKCEDPSPCTNIPSCVVLLWHEAQVPLTSVWLTWEALTVQLLVEWQLPQLVDVLKCDGPSPCTNIPSCVVLL